MTSTLSSVLNIASTGIQASQTALSVVSDNVANVNTPGYVQKKVDQSSEVVGGQGQGVSIADVKRVTNSYLEAASYIANAGSGSAGAVSGTMDQAQTLFGDPTESGSLFSNLDSVFSAFSTLSADQTSAGQTQAVSSVSTFFNQASSISGSLQTLSSQADSQISTDVGTVNGLLTQISDLNATISQGYVSGQDVTGAQNQQGTLINQLSSLMDMKVNSNGVGGVQILATNGASLVGIGGAASLAYDSSGPTGSMTITDTAGNTTAFNGGITSGSIGGLLQLRNVDLPATSSQLASLTSGVADQLNAIHNSYSSVPPPTTMTGQTTGQDIATAAAGFTGQTTIALVNTSTEALTHSIAINFDAGTMSVDGGATTSFTPSTFLSTLNSALSSAGGGSASYTNGVLSLSSGSSTTGIAIQDSSTDPSSNGGKGFSDFFGLNDLVTSSSISNYNTGMTATSATGFPAGQTMTLQLASASGALLKTVTVTTPAGGTAADLVNALNSPTTGVGAYGSYALNSSGELTFTANNNSGVTVGVYQDSTENSSGVSVSELFGIGATTRIQAASDYTVRSDIAATPSNLATASLTLSAGSGQPVLAAGDTSGADALGQAGLSTLNFDAVSGVSAQTSTLSNYAASISSAIANKASAADSAQSMASTVATNATSALSSVEGVSIDQELINLTTYQQAYNASARMVQAANDLYTTLLDMTQN
jgi:flagellar hook-associated protein 1 FlgK